jgi:hypothetical protein
MRNLNEVLAIVKSHKDIKEEKRRELINLIDEYEKAKLGQVKKVVTRTALWIMLKQIIDYLEDIWN